MFDNGIKNQPVKSALAVILSILSLAAMGQVKTERLARKDNVMPRILDSATIAVMKQSVDRNLISQTLLKANPSQNFAELLQKQSGIFIRSRGAGVLSTPSYKGLGTQQTPILINGANMQSSMNGTMDLSIIDAAHFGGLSLCQADANSTGVQNMGDAISLSSLNSPRGLHLGISGSTQEEYSATVKYVTGKKKWYYGISGIATQSENVVDLDHYNMPDVQPNTDFKRASILQTVGYKWARSQWTNTLYLQGAERGIPPPFYQINKSRQQDANAMMVNKFRHRSRNYWVWEIANQLWAEQIVFDNWKSGETTDSRVLNVNTTASVSKYFKRTWSARLGAALDMANYESEALVANATWNRPRVFFDIAKRFKKVKLELHQNTIAYEGKLATSGGLTANGGFAKIYQWTASVQRVYRLPVLNELYWYNPGKEMGNDSLLPEQGYKAEAKLSRYGKNMQVTINPHIGTFENWIQWTGATEISPVNIHSVMVYGAVLTANHEKKFKGIRLLTQANINYVRATYQYEDENDTRNGKQLIFTPQLTGNLTFTVVHSNLGLYANAHLVSSNYYSSDNISSLDPYQLYELGGYYEWPQIRIGAVASNVLNTPYFTQPRTPLLGRNFKININYTIKS